MFCGACELLLPDDAFSVEQRGLRRSIRRCIACVAAGNQLVLMTRGTTREDDICPVCQSVLPIEVSESMTQPCCMNLVCNGCLLSSIRYGIRNCPLCRTAFPTNESQVNAMVQKRIAAGDPMAICFRGDQLRCGLNGFVMDVSGGIELCRQAAELGVKEAHYTLGQMYGPGGDLRLDSTRSVEHFEKAAMSGHVMSRFTLGVLEYNDGRKNLSLQHFLISAKLGHKASLGAVQRLLKEGIATEKDYAGALQECEAAVDEMSSPSRDEAKTLGRGKVVMYNMVE